MKNSWDERYRNTRYFYGTEPNALVAAALSKLSLGHGLYVAEGEGRNAVHAAEIGHVVTAFDSSVEARSKALALAEARSVGLDYLNCDARDTQWEVAGPFDHIVLCFFHTTPDLRSTLHARFAAALKTGGRIIVVSFAKEQLEYETGGPPRLEWLHDLAEIRSEFPDVTWERAEMLEVLLKEGPGHEGTGAVNYLVGTKV